MTRCRIEQIRMEVTENGDLVSCTNLIELVSKKYEVTTKPVYNWYHEFIDNIYLIDIKSIDELKDIVKLTGCSVTYDGECIYFYDDWME